MNKLTQIAISLVAVVGMGGLAVAGDAKDPKAAGAPKADAPKAGAPKADAPKADAPKADAKAADAKPMEMKPPQELADMAKMSAGTWKCKGQGMGHDMKLADMTGTMKMKLEVDNWWVHGSFDSKMGKDSFKFESFTSYDPASKKWHRVMVESGGGYSMGDSMGMKDNKVDWELQSHGMMGDMGFRDHEDMTDAKAPKMWGEMQDPKTKSWIKVYEMACKK
ncbi:MAG: hypothetical protein JWO36_834 [Myxococcales bacterium]|nr:hypothetical protein [Myxococcales bacterium]